MLEELIVVLNPKKGFKLEYINQNQFLDKLAISSSDILDKSFLRLIHPEDTKQFKKSLKKYPKVKIALIQREWTLLSSNRLFL